ncbi:MAG: M20/M25/M40 family metallo-hydrolase [Planctomycetota bacterium]
MTDAFATLQDWIEIDSVTGGEGDYGDALGRALAAEGLGVERQELSPGRFNVLARAANPEVVFCTHLDTVPPWFGSERKGNVVFGRGACDAKGPALAMLLAARRLLAEGEDRIGFLLTVGEETDGAGAVFANEQLADPWSPRFTIVGEPTDNSFVRGHKGVYKCNLRAHGVAGHSSQDVGPSAIHELVTVLQGILGDDWGEHARFGSGTVNVGEIGGGLAANVVAPEAQAELLLRIVQDPVAVTEKLRTHLTEHVELELGKNYGPVEFLVPEDQESIAVAFGTDAPHLSAWGTPLLYGPGSILDAHTADEKLTLESFERAVDDYARTAAGLLGSE